METLRLHLAYHSGSSGVTHIDPRNWTRPDPTQPADGPDPCPTLGPEYVEYEEPRRSWSLFMLAFIKHALS